MNSETEIFIEHWYQIVLIWSQIALVGSVLIFLFYGIILLTKRKLSVKYEYISANEIRYLKYSGLCIAASVTFYLNYVLVYYFYTSTNFELTFKTIVSLAIGFLVGYTINTYLTIYYPFRLEKRLHNIRFKKRISPKSGREMVLLDEESEDVHLTEEMIEHEKINAYEYDVWLDEETGYKIIEKYEGSKHLIICDNCNYRTSRELSEEVITEPTEYSPGTLKKYYKCFYCEHRQQVESKIAPLDKQLEV